MRRRTKIALVAFGIVLSVAAPAIGLMQVNDGKDVGQNVSFDKANGPNVTVGQDINITNENPWNQSNKIILDPWGEFQSNGNTSLRVTQFNGTWTNATNINATAADLTLIPNDKPNLTVGGAVTAVSYQDNISLADDKTAFEYSATSSGTITVNGLPANTDYTAATTTGTKLDSGTTTGGGAATVSVTSASSDDVILFTNSAPQASNLRPPDGSELTDSTVTFEVNVTDEEFGTDQGDQVTAELFIDGNSVGTDTVSSNTTASVTTDIVEGGDHTYKWNLTDSYDATTLTSTNTVAVPNTLYLYNETQNATGQHELLDGVNASVDITITGSGGSVKSVTISDGMINMTGLPSDESYVFTVDADGYYPREVYIESIYDQSAVFLLNESMTAVQNSLTVTDRTGQFEDPIITVERVINTSRVGELTDNGDTWVTIGGDRLGASGFYIDNLQKSSRYRFVVINQDGDTRVLGEYTAKADGEVPLEIGSIEYDLRPTDSAYKWTTTATNESGNPAIKFAYNDASDLTTYVNATFRYRSNGTIIATKNFTSGPYGEVVFTEPVNQSVYNSQDFVVEWTAERNGSVIEGGNIVGGTRNVRPPLADVWMEIAYGTGVFVLAFVAGAGIGAPAAAATVSVFAALSVFMGLAPPALGFGATILALFLSVAMLVFSGRQEI